MVVDHNGDDTPKKCGIGVLLDQLVTSLGVSVSRKSPKKHKKSKESLLERGALTQKGLSVNYSNKHGIIHSSSNSLKHSFSENENENVKNNEFDESVFSEKSVVGSEEHKKSTLNSPDHSDNSTVINKKYDSDLFSNFDCEERNGQNSCSSLKNSCGSSEGKSKNNHFSKALGDCIEKNNHNRSESANVDCKEQNLHSKFNSPKNNASLKNLKAESVNDVAYKEHNTHDNYENGGDSSKDISEPPETNDPEQEKLFTDVACKIQNIHNKSNAGTLKNNCDIGKGREISNFENNLNDRNSIHRQPQINNNDKRSYNVVTGEGQHDNFAGTQTDMSPGSEISGLQLNAPKSLILTHAHSPEHELFHDETANHVPENSCSDSEYQHLCHSCCIPLSSHTFEEHCKCIGKIEISRSSSNSVATVISDYVRGKPKNREATPKKTPGAKRTGNTVATDVGVSMASTSTSTSSNANDDSHIFVHKLIPQTSVDSNCTTTIEREKGSKKATAKSRRKSEGTSSSRKTNATTESRRKSQASLSSINLNSNATNSNNEQFNSDIVTVPLTNNPLTAKQAHPENQDSTELQHEILNEEIKYVYGTKTRHSAPLNEIDEGNKLIESEISTKITNKSRRATILNVNQNGNSIIVNTESQAKSDAKPTIVSPIPGTSNAGSGDPTELLQLELLRREIDSVFKSKSKSNGTSKEIKVNGQNICKRNNNGESLVINNIENQDTNFKSRCDTSFDSINTVTNVLGDEHHFDQESSPSTSVSTKSSKKKNVANVGEKAQYNSGIISTTTKVTSPVLHSNYQDCIELLQQDLLNQEIRSVYTHKGKRSAPDRDNVSAQSEVLSKTRQNGIDLHISSSAKEIQSYSDTESSKNTTQESEVNRSKLSATRKWKIKLVDSATNGKDLSERQSINKHPKIDIQRMSSTKDDTCRLEEEGQPESPKKKYNMMHKGKTQTFSPISSNDSLFNEINSINVQEELLLSNSEKYEKIKLEQSSDGSSFDNVIKLKKQTHKKSLLEKRNHNGVNMNKLLHEMISKELSMRSMDMLDISTDERWKDKQLPSSTLNDSGSDSIFTEINCIDSSDVQTLRISSGRLPVGYGLSELPSKPMSLTRLLETTELVDVPCRTSVSSSKSKKLCGASDETCGPSKCSTGTKNPQKSPKHGTANKLENINCESSEVTPVKIKKRKRLPSTSENISYVGYVSSETSVSISGSKLKKDKESSKKEKHRKSSSTTCEMMTNIDVPSESVKSSSSKKKKHNDYMECENTSNEMSDPSMFLSSRSPRTCETISEIHSKKKKKKTSSDTIPNVDLRLSTQFSRAASGISVCSEDKSQNSENIEAQSETISSEALSTSESRKHKKNKEKKHRSLLSEETENPDIIGESDAKKEAAEDKTENAFLSNSKTIARLSRQWSRTATDISCGLDDTQNLGNISSEVLCTSETPKHKKKKKHSNLLSGRIKNADTIFGESDGKKNTTEDENIEAQSETISSEVLSTSESRKHKKNKRKKHRSLLSEETENPYIIGESGGKKGATEDKTENAFLSNSKTIARLSRQWSRTATDISCGLDDTQNSGNISSEVLCTSETPKHKKKKKHSNLLSGRIKNADTIFGESDGKKETTEDETENSFSSSSKNIKRLSKQCSRTATDISCGLDDTQNSGNISSEVLCTSETPKHKKKKKHRSLSSEEIKHEIILGESKKETSEDETENACSSNSKNVNRVSRRFSRTDSGSSYSFDDEIEASEEIKRKLGDINILVPWEIPPLHIGDTHIGAFPSKKAQEEKKALGIEIKKGIFTKNEDELIKRNFALFCEYHELPHDPVPFINLKQSHGYIMSHEQRIRFAQFLGHGLGDRYLHAIYKRFCRLSWNTIGKVGKFTPQEDKLILSHIQTTNSNSPIVDLAKKFKRSSSSVYKRYKILTRKNDERIKWTPLLIEEFLKNLLDVSSVEKISSFKTREITTEEFTEISKRMNISVVKLRKAWKAAIYPKIFGVCLTNSESIIHIKMALVSMLYEMKADDWRQVNFSELAKRFEGITGRTLYIFLKTLIKAKVPEKYHNNFRKCIKYLEKHKTEVIQNARKKAIPIYKFKDGRLILRQHLEGDDT